MNYIFFIDLTAREGHLWAFQYHLLNYEFTTEQVKVILDVISMAQYKAAVTPVR